MGTIRILGVHGLGDHRQAPWKEEWEAAVRRSFPNVPGVELDFSFLSYDQIFEKVDLSVWETTKAVYKLLRSGVGSIFGGRGVAPGARGVSDVLRWYAGYVVAWVEDEEFKKKTRALVLAALKEHQPDVVLAHSLGTLVTYDAINHKDAAAQAAVLSKLTYVTLGSQLGNAFVRGNLTTGRIVMPPVRAWRHLYNEEDDVFTEPIVLPDEPKFRQIETFFDIEGIADHSATEYLGHRSTQALLWEPLAQEEAATGAPKGKGLAFKAFLAPSKKSEKLDEARKRDPRRRALLVGINEYPSESDRLSGCVNDVFLMSEALQECGFPARDIRICLDKRATAQGILERMDWLVDGAIAKDELFFFYSGHGAQLPTYGEGDAVDRMDETLVPWDFDWTPEKCITDDRIFDFYTQLPYDSRLVMMFDCCHSGGIHRAGAPRARGINPPDDIRHRALKWDWETGTWEQRPPLETLDAGFSDDEDVSRRFFGKEHRTARIGRASAMRKMDRKKYELAVKASKAPVGPYLPLILEACAEDELAYEYRHGATSYGAFTYTLVSALRRRKQVTFEGLVTAAGETIEGLGYTQHPQILGPTKIMKAQVPWMKRKR